MQYRILLSPKAQKRKFFAETEFGVNQICLSIDQNQFGLQKDPKV